MLSATTLIIVLYKTARAAPAGSSNELATSNVASIDPLPDTYDYDESEYYGGASNKPTSGGNDDGDCTDIWSAGKCREKADAGKCNKPNAVLKCKATRGLCSYPPSAPPSLTCNDLAACNKYSSPRPSPPPSSIGSRGITGGCRGPSSKGEARQGCPARDLQPRWQLW